MNFETTDLPRVTISLTHVLPVLRGDRVVSKKLSRDMQSKSVEKVVAEAEEWAGNGYSWLCKRAIA